MPARRRAGRDDPGGARPGGRPGAFEALARRHQAALYRVAVRVLGDPVEAEDALQEALIDAWRRIGRFRTDSVVLHLDVPHRDQPLPGPAAPAAPGAGRGDRRPTARARRPRAGPPSWTPGWPRWAGRSAALPDELRVCWVLRELEGLGYADIAQITEASEDAVRGRIHRARVRLAEVMARGGDRTGLGVGGRPGRADRPAALRAGRRAGLGPRRGRPAPDEHERGCPHCGAAFADAGGCTGSCTGWPPSRSSRRPRCSTGRWPRCAPSSAGTTCSSWPRRYGPARLSRPAAAAVLRHAVDRMAGVRARSCRIEQAADPGPDGHRRPRT